MEHELIMKFLRNECTAEEAAAVSNYFRENPDALDKFLPDDDFEAFEPEGESVLPQGQGARMLEHIDRNITTTGKVTPLRIYAAAAAAVAVIVAGVLFFMRPATTNTVARASYTTEPAPQLAWETKTNEGDKEVSYTLPDSSVITLAAHSKVRYLNRKVYLEGKANFSVHAQPERPFIVYSKYITTTAIGTVFTVSAYNDARNTTVQLLKGKVLVGPADTTATFDVVVLDPGRAFVFDNKAMKGAVSAPETLAPIAGTTVIRQDSILFHDESLAHIIIALKKVYGVNIQAEKRMPDIRFTGAFDKRADSVDSILHTIASLNNLVISETTEGFIITK